MKTRFALSLIAAVITFAAPALNAASLPFALTVSVEGPFVNGYEPTEGSTVVKSGSKVYLDIKKTNTSNHNIGCSRTFNTMTGLDSGYEYDIRDDGGKPVAKNEMNHSELATKSVEGIGCELKPGESRTSGGNEITRLYSFSRPGKYTIQVSEPASDNPKDGIVRSNILVLTVTNDESLIETATPPFALLIAPYSEGRVGESDHLTAKAGAEIGINIQKVNIANHDIDCSSSWNNLSGLDESYDYDIRDKTGNPVGKRVIERPLPFSRGPGEKTCKPGESGGSASLTLTRLYDLSKPGTYTVKVLQAVPSQPNLGPVKSNIVRLTVVQ